MPPNSLKTGYTTGACATAAVTAAYGALLTGEWSNPITIVLPRGQQASFALTNCKLGDGWAQASVTKDAGDDPDVTHGALISARISEQKSNSVRFKAGKGVGIVTRAGLPIDPGEPAINPVPRAMMISAINKLAQQHGGTGAVEIEISVRNGEKLAKQTWNPRLGIMGGISILGTTGIVRPYSCSAWIASIRQGIDVALAGGARHICAVTGSTSEQTMRKKLALADWQIIEMGDFIGATLKYLRNNSPSRITIAGGFGKMIKFAQGAGDLHSLRSQIDFSALIKTARIAGLSTRAIEVARSAGQLLELGDPSLPNLVAQQARAQAKIWLGDQDIELNIHIIDRLGRIVGTA